MPSRKPARRRAHKHLEWAHVVLDAEAKAIGSLKRRLDQKFVDAVELVLACKGRIAVSGIGKPGFIAQKLSATLASVGVPSIFLHPAEAAHGDLGRVADGDVAILLSNSGASEEVVRLLLPLKRLGVKCIAITGDKKSPLANGADAVVDIGSVAEASPMGLVPTASSAALHAVCDALAMCVAHARELTAEQYALRHPGGALGRRVLKVEELMRKGAAHPRVSDDAPLSEVVVVMTNTKGRPGAANVVDSKGRLVGIFTDGDLRRLAEQRRLDFSTPVEKVMSARPRCVSPNDLVLAAAALMREAAVDQLPVVDGEGKAVGLLDVQDLLAARLV